ncbi:hypothetical protein AB205_0203170 [Aquarana catesbeiana]|uniref:Uncharacterized protein n=1 Tax=Aquarana catesbeiana TaxID=8400 RepID=A0A2G9RTG5_AQUCT|nr:hypothetical protein AB205_0203170 [Aquarana catesbeiana]
MVESTSQEQTRTSDQVQEESEYGELTQDVYLEPWDLTPEPSKDHAIVDVKSPDTSHTEGQSDPEEEESIQEPLVCASHDLPRCTIGRMSADMLHCLKDLEQIKKAATALQRRIRDFVDMLAKFLFPLAWSEVSCSTCWLCLPFKYLPHFYDFEM